MTHRINKSYYMYSFQVHYRSTSGTCRTRIPVYQVNALVLVNLDRQNCYIVVRESPYLKK